MSEVERHDDSRSRFTLRVWRPIVARALRERGGVAMLVGGGIVVAAIETMLPLMVGRIVDEARRFADAVGAELHLAHAVDPIIDLPADPTMQLVGTTPLMAEELQALQRGRFERLAETMGFDRSQCHLLIGRADVALEGLCERIGADLLVTGHHRRQPLERLLGGSVSEGLIGTARRAVMVIPDGIAPHAD